MLELAVGTGRNLAHYNPDVRLRGIELSPAMLEIARGRAREAACEADLQLGDAQALDFPDESFDTVVWTLSLCTIPDDRAAVAEVRRVLRPGARFLVLEHVRSTRSGIRAGQLMLDPLAVRFEGDHIAREPLKHLQAENFVVNHVHRSKYAHPSTTGIGEATQQPSPAQASRPSEIASAAIASAITGSSHHHSSAALATRPTSTPAAM